MYRTHWTCTEWWIQYHSKNKACGSAHDPSEAAWTQLSDSGAVFILLGWEGLPSRVHAAAYQSARRVQAGNLQERGRTTSLDLGKHGRFFLFLEWDWETWDETQDFLWGFFFSNLLLYHSVKSGLNSKENVRAHLFCFFTGAPNANQCLPCGPNPPTWDIIHSSGSWKLHLKTQ